MKISVSNSVHQFQVSTVRYAPPRLSASVRFGADSPDGDVFKRLSERKQAIENQVVAQMLDVLSTTDPDKEVETAIQPIPFLPPLSVKAVDLRDLFELLVQLHQQAVEKSRDAEASPPEAEKPPTNQLFLDELDDLEPSSEKPDRIEFKPIYRNQPGKGRASSDAEDSNRPKESISLKDIHARYAKTKSEQDLVAQLLNHLQNQGLIESVETSDSRFPKPSLFGPSSHSYYVLTELGLRVMQEHQANLEDNRGDTDTDWNELLGDIAGL